MKTVALALCFAGLATGAFAQTLSLKGPAGQAASLTAGDLAGLPRVSVAFDSHGEKHV